MVDCSRTPKTGVNVHFPRHGHYAVWSERSYGHDNAPVPLDVLGV